MSHQALGSRVLSVIAFVSLFAACTQQSLSAAAAPATAPPPPAPVSPPPLVRGLPDFAPLVEAVGPAVVNVKVIERAQARNRANAQTSPFEEDDALGEFFRRFGIDPRGGGGPQPRREGQGSGFIVTRDGYVLTNAHVVEGATSISVTLTDRREYAAKVIGTDEGSDVAVLKIEGKNLPTARLGDPSRLRVGEWVVAIGSPFGFQNSVTAGIVSATSRQVPSEGPTNYVNFIQSDVAVNPGNSGGPLFNLSGEVVGINSQIYSNTGSFAGLSFSIPIDIANNVREQLVKTGRVTRGRLGVSIKPVTADLADGYGLDRPRGALVTQVVEDGPAAKAGIRSEDIILKVNGRIVETMGELPPMVATIKPGTTAQVEVWRGKAARNINVTVDELPVDATRSARMNPQSDRDSGAGASVGLGLSVRELTAQEKQRLRTEGNLVVVEAAGAAADAGIQSGDVILRANGKPINSVDELRNAVKGKGTVPLVIQNESGQNIVAVKPE